MHSLVHSHFHHMYRFLAIYQCHVLYIKWECNLSINNKKDYIKLIYCQNDQTNHCQKPRINWSIPQHLFKNFSYILVQNIGFSLFIVSTFINIYNKAFKFYGFQLFENVLNKIGVCDVKFWVCDGSIQWRAHKHKVFHFFSTPSYSSMCPN